MACIRWRVNCAIQVFLYEGDPLHPNPDEIARVTDYIVVYTCKGNESFVKEMKQMKGLILGCYDITGTTNDAKKIAKNLLNKTAKDNIISVQKHMWHLAKLNLYFCLEFFEKFSISGEYCFSTPGKYNLVFSKICKKRHYKMI